MWFNQATDYAFRAVLHLAKGPEGQIMTAQSIAEEEKIPMRFLLKIMRALTQEGIVKSYRGNGGGYTLFKKPEDITLLDVVTAIEGPINLHRCLHDHRACNKNQTGDCSIHQALGQIEHNLIVGLRSQRFRELTTR